MTNEVVIYNKNIGYILGDIKYLEIFMGKFIKIGSYFLKNSTFLLKAKLYLKAIND